jgi:hypothetical protein
MGNSLSTREEENPFFCADNCCTDENLDQRRTLSESLKTPRKPKQTRRNPNAMSEGESERSLPPESSWIGPHVEVQDGVVQLEDGTVLYMHDKQDEKRSPGSQLVQKSKRKQLLSVSTWVPILCDSPLSIHFPVCRITFRCTQRANPSNMC